MLHTRSCIHYQTFPQVLTSIATSRYFSARLGVTSHYGVLFPTNYYTGSVRYAISSRLPTGTYNLTVHTDYRNHVFEYNANNNNIGWKMISILEWHPDLTISANVILQTSSQGNLLAVVYSVQNSGVGPTYGSVWRDRISLTGIDSGRVYTLDTTTHRGALSAGTTYSGFYYRYLDRSIYGNFTLTVTVDLDNRIIESDEDNNAYLYTLTVPL